MVTAYPVDKTLLVRYFNKVLPTGIKTNNAFAVQIISRWPPDIAFVSAFANLDNIVATDFDGARSPEAF